MTAQMPLDTRLQERLSPAQCEMVNTACAALLPKARERFLIELAEVIPTSGELGDGLVHRCMRAVWAKHFDIPEL